MYLEVIRSVSHCLKLSGSFREYNVGEIIEIHILDGVPMLYRGKECYKAEFKLDCFDIENKGISLNSCIMFGYLKDVTKVINRERKLLDLL